MNYFVIWGCLLFKNKIVMMINVCGDVKEIFVFKKKEKCYYNEYRNFLLESLFKKYINWY